MLAPGRHQGSQRWWCPHVTGSTQLGSCVPALPCLPPWCSAAHSRLSASLRPPVLQHTRLPCPSPPPRACSNSISIELVMPPTHLARCYSLLLPPSIPPSIRVFSNESALRMRWPKCWSFSFSTSPSNEHPGLISFRMDWLDLLAVQGTLRSLLQHHGSKPSILQFSALFMLQLSHPYMTTGETAVLTIGTFVPL